MDISIIQIIMGLFIATFLINIYFRIRVITAFNALKKSGIEMSARDVMNQDVLENTIIPKHQKYEKQIRDYVRYIKIGFGMTSILLFLIISFAIVLMRTK